MRAFGKSNSSGGLVGTGGVAGGMSDRGAGSPLALGALEAGSGSSFSEAEGGCEDEPHMSRSATEGEMRRGLSPNYHGVGGITGRMACQASTVANVLV